MAVPRTLVYELEITALGPLVEEFTAHGVWVFFGREAPEELAEFALLHGAAAPKAPLTPGQLLEIGAEQYTIRAVGALANQNVRELGHLVLKANGASKAELPGEICIDARPLPQPSVGTVVRVWEQKDEVTP